MILMSALFWQMKRHYPHVTAHFAPLLVLPVFLSDSLWKEDPMPNNVMLITGTSKGIWKFLAHYYVSCGYTVIGCSRTQPEWELQNYTHINADITNEASVKAVFKTIK